MSYFAQSSTHLRINQDRKANGLPTLADTEILRLSRVLRSQKPLATDAEIQAELIEEPRPTPNADGEPKKPVTPAAEVDNFAVKVETFLKEVETEFTGEGAAKLAADVDASVLSTITKKTKPKKGSR